MTDSFVTKILPDIKNRIEALRKLGRFVLVAIDGNSGAGKSTLSEKLSDLYDCNVFHMDDFFLPPKLKTKERLNEPGGNVDYDRFKNEVIDGILSRGEFEYQTYNCSIKKFDRIVRVKPKKLNIIEGVYSLHPVLVNSYNLKIFLKTDETFQHEKILQRGGEAMLKRFIEEWIPLENRYFQVLKIEDQCDLVFTQTV